MKNGFLSTDGRTNKRIRSFVHPLFYSLIVLFWLISFGFPAWAGSGANFLLMGGGARPLAMGEAYVALADDSSSIFWNPAGLAKMNLPEVLYMSNQWLVDVQHQYFNIAFPSRLGSFGGSYSLLDSGDIPGYDPGGSQTGTIKATNSSLAFSWAGRIRENLAIGVGLKSISEVLASEEATSSAMDVGLLFDLTPKLSFGAVVQNIGSPLKFISEETPLPQAYRLGIALKNKVFDNALNLAVDYVSYMDGTSFTNLGIEYLLKDSLALRAGSLNGGLRTGVGLKVAFLKLDYAFSQNDLGATNQVSLSFQLGH